jgi:hypothetical protein
MNTAPLHVSKRAAKSLWQQYRVYSDRLELQSWLLLRTLVIRRSEILAVEIRPSIFSGRKGFTWGIKIDFCDFCPHVLLTKRAGLLKRIGFSPDDPELFVEIWKSTLEASR